MTIADPPPWPEVELGTFHPFVTSGSRGWGRYYSDDGDLFVRITNLSRSDIHLDLADTKFVKLPASEREGVRTSIQNGDVLISITADIGIAGYVDERVPKPAYINQHVASVRFPNNTLDGRFVAYFLASEGPQKSFKAMTDTGAKAGMSLSTVKRIKVLCPPLDEQRAIALALKSIDELIASLDALIAKKRDIQRATMQQLLAGKARLPGFQKNWNQATLSEIATIQRGASPRPIDSPLWFDEYSSIGWVRISDVTRSGIKLTETAQRLSPLGVKHSRYVPSGSLIMSICATVGRPVITGLDACIHDGFVVFSALNVDMYFLYFALRNIEDEWAQMGQTGSQMNLNTSMINSKKIALPSDRAEQAAIAEVALDLVNEIAALEAKAEKVRATKDGMMQQLLTGRIRLV